MKTKRRFLSVTLCILIVVSGIIACTVPASAVVSPHLSVDYVPVIDNGSYISGHIWFEDESADFSNYSVTLYLKVGRSDSNIWGPKPTFANPSVPLSEDGRFSLQFATGGYDAQAEVLYVFLIPRSLNPSTYAIAESGALEKVTVNRYADGRIDIDQIQEPEIDREEAMEQQKHPRFNCLLSVNYSPYVNGMRPGASPAPTPALVRSHFDAIAPYVDTIRLFDCDELGFVYQIAKEEYGFRVIGGAWTDGGAGAYAQLDKLINLANQGYVDVASVSSESLYRGTLTASQIVLYIQYVKNGIHDKTIPVTTSDVAGSLIDNPSVITASDMVLYTVYPFFEGKAVENSLGTVTGVYEHLKALAGDKTVIISETGWPTDGTTAPGSSAVPGIENAKFYFRQVNAWAKVNDVEVVYFEAFDEQYKTEGSAGDIGRNWGLFYGSGSLKEAYTEDFIAIAAEGLHQKYTDVVFKLNSTQTLVNREQKTMISTATGEPIRCEIVPKQDGGKTMIPLRFLSEAFGADVEWDPDMGTAGGGIIRLMGKTLYVPIDSRLFIRVDDDSGAQESVIVPGDYPPAQIIGYSTYIPLRTVTEAFGYKVDYQGQEYDSIDKIMVGYALITSYPEALPGGLYFTEMYNAANAKF